MKILVIGNGAIGAYQNKQFYINNHTGDFLGKVNGSHKVVFSQGISSYDVNSDLQNFELYSTNISFCYIKNIRNPFEILKHLRIILKNEFVYIFTPGTLGRVTALLAIIFKQDYALYVRGEYFNQYWFDRHILSKSKFILTVSPYFKRELRKYCKRVEVIKPMISIGKEDINKSRNYDYPSKWNILFVGRVEYRKGIEELIEIGEKLYNSGLNIELNIVGGGELYEAKKKNIEERNLSDFIKLHGQISDKNKLLEFYLNATIFVFTSHDEGFPRVLYEAMASGLSIFTTFVGGIPGRMVRNKNCIEIPVKNSSLSAEIILESIKDKELLRRIGQAGQSTLEEILAGEYLSHDELLLKNLKND